MFILSVTPGSLTSSELDNDNVKSYNINGAGGFDSMFPFEYVIKF